MWLIFRMVIVFLFPTQGVMDLIILSRRRRSKFQKEASKPVRHQGLGSRIRKIVGRRVIRARSNV